MIKTFFQGEPGKPGPPGDAGLQGLPVSIYFFKCLLVYMHTLIYIDINLGERSMGMPP